MATPLACCLRNFTYFDVADAGTQHAAWPGMSRDIRLFILAHLALVMLASFGR